MKTVIVGGVAAGAPTGARLRRLDESAEIVVLGRDRYVSFANCGLPYHIGGAIRDRDSLLLQTPESLARALALDVRTGQDVICIDRDAKEVEVHDLAQGQTYRESYDKLVLCLGAEPIPRAATLTSTATRSPGSRDALAWFALADLTGHSRMFALCTKDSPSRDRCAAGIVPVCALNRGRSARITGSSHSHHHTRQG